CYTVASLAPELPERRIRGDARAKERCGSRRVQSLGDAQHVALVDDHVRRITAVRPCLPVRLEAVERERDALLAEHLVCRLLLEKKKKNMKIIVIAVHNGIH